MYFVPINSAAKNGVIIQFQKVRPKAENEVRVHLASDYERDVTKTRPVLDVWSWTENAFAVS